MENLKNMLTKSQEVIPTTENIEENEVSFCIKLPFTCAEYIKDFQYFEAFSTGNLHYSLKDAFIDIIKYHKKNHSVTKRPESVRIGEKKRKRKN